MLAPHVTVTRAELDALRASRVFIPVDDAVFRIEGAGTFTCLQGLLTNDVVKLAAHSAAWGAFLTAKGMIVSDAWIVRDGDAAWVIVPGAAHVTMQQLFAKTMPPRLAKVVDHTGKVSVRWLLGGAIGPVEGTTIARSEAAAPFASLMLATDATADARLLEQGWTAAPASAADALKVLLGWPTLGREIDERTLPQEVRFDELGGVKYDKGCYTGQETVARLHFRGHANRKLVALRWTRGDGPTDASVTRGGKEVGSLRTIARLGDDLIALAILRREILAGESVDTGDTAADVVALPIDSDKPAVA